MHLGQTRHQVPALPRDHVHPFGRLETVGVVERRYPSVGDYDRLVLEHPVAVHREDVDADEREIPLDDGGRLAAVASRERHNRQR